MKKKILIFSGYYIPSIKAGGPVQSLKNLVENLSSEFEFYIVANDRDLGDSHPFPNITPNEWQTTNNMNIYYIKSNKLTFKKIISLINETECDTVYLNSLFSYRQTILPLLVNKLRKNLVKRVAIAPRGCLSDGALSLKSRKKTVFLKIANLFGLYKNVEWHATSTGECEDIKNKIVGNHRITQINNLTASYANYNCEKDIKKDVGVLKMVYIARIHPMKNLYQIIDVLQNIKGSVEFNIYGPIEDHEYWEKCLAKIKLVPDNVTINYNGIAQREEIQEIHSKHHIYILLTLGENFGHSISEALIGANPVIISDKTPWKQLEKHNAGYDLPLENNLIKTTLNKVINQSEEEYRVMSIGAFDYAKKISLTTIDNEINKYIKFFNK